MTYRAGIIGCGDVGSTLGDKMLGSPGHWVLPHAHAPSYEAVARTELVAAADLVADTRRAFSERWALPPDKVYADYREMFSREHLDIVSVATPTPLHAEMALAALDAGAKAIFLEKPIASSLEDADRVVEACARAGVPLAVNHSRRGDLSYRKARELIDDGAIGRLHSVMALFAGNLMWIGTHAFDTMNYFAGDRQVSWVAGETDPGTEIDPGGNCLYAYENGVRGFVNGAVGSGVGFRLHAIGTDGEIVIGRFDLQLWRNNPNGRLRYEPLLYPFPQSLPFVSPMVHLIEELVDAVEGGPEPISNGRTAVTALEQIVAVHCSSLIEGGRVRVPDDLDRRLTVSSL